jgi:hypothetical protein
LEGATPVNPGVAPPGQQSEGSTRLWEQERERMAAALAQHDARARAMNVRHRAIHDASRRSFALEGAASFPCHSSTT